MLVPATSTAAARAEDLTALRDAYLEAVLAPDARGARALLEDAAAGGVPADRLCGGFEDDVAMLAFERLR